MSAGDREPVLELRASRPPFKASRLPPIALDLRLMPGDCVLVETPDARRASAFADLCSGLLPLDDGEVRFLGIDWRTVPARQAAALRGRIGRVHRFGAWAPMLGTHGDIMLSPLHHTRTPQAELIERATELSRRLGLPGLPVGRPGLLSDADLARAACVRAFLGEPSLLLLENPVTGASFGLLAPLLDLLVDARERGAAAICLIREPAIWQPYAPFVTRRLSLDDRGLVTGRFH